MTLVTCEWCGKEKNRHPSDIKNNRRKRFYCCRRCYQLSTGKRPTGVGTKRDAVDQVVSSLTQGMEYPIAQLVEMCERAPGRYHFTTREVSGYIRGSGLHRTRKGYYVKEVGA